MADKQHAQVLQKAIALMEKLRPMTAYGVVGSRDVDQAENRRNLDGCLAALRALQATAEPIAPPEGATLRQRADTALQGLPDAPYRAMLARLFDDMLATAEPPKPQYTQSQVDRLLMPPPAMTETERVQLNQEAANLIRLLSSRAAPPSPQGERTPQDYAIEHAEYMAQAAEHLLAKVNDWGFAIDVEDENAIPEATESLTDARASMASAIYEFRKRRDRAAEQGEQAIAQAKQITIANRWGRLYALIDSGSGLDRVGAMVPLSYKPGSVEEKAARQWMSAAAATQAQEPAAPGVEAAGIGVQDA